MSKTKRYTHKLFFESGTEVVVETTKSFRAAMKMCGVSPALGEWVLWERAGSPNKKRYYYVKGVKGYKCTWHEDKGKLSDELIAVRKEKLNNPIEVIDFSKSDPRENERQIELSITESGVLTRYKVRNSLFRLRDNRVEPKDVYLVNIIWDVIRKQLRRGENIQDFSHTWDVNPQQPLQVIHKERWVDVKDERYQEIYEQELQIQKDVMARQYGGGEIPERSQVEAAGRAKRSAERKLASDAVNKVFTEQK
jgi:hypothetical protein